MKKVVSLFLIASSDGLVNEVYNKDSYNILDYNRVGYAMYNKIIYDVHGYGERGYNKSGCNIEDFEKNGDKNSRTTFTKISKNISSFFFRA
jgi:hypothetical protein